MQLISTIIAYDLYIFILVTVLSFGLFIISGKDKPLYLGDLYHPPQDITPAEARYALTGDVEKRDIFSLLFYWAQKGTISIKEDMGGLEFIKVNEFGRDVPKYEKDLFRIIFNEYGNGNAVHTRDLAGKLYMPIWKVSGGIKGDYNNKDRSSQVKKIVLIITGTVLSAVPYMFLMARMGGALSNSAEISNEGAFISVGVGLLFALFTSFVSFVVRKWFTDGAEGNIGNTVWSIIMFLMVNGLLAAMGSTIGVTFGQVLKTAFFALILSFILGLIRMRTTYGHRQYQHIVGFRDSLAGAVKPNAVELIRNNPILFYENIPYAAAFNIGEEWGSKFEGLIDNPPDWYTGYDYKKFSPRQFGKHIEDLLSGISEELAPNPIPTGNIRAGMN